jgi:uncharacterized Zn finger protein (UPF0148 family)
MSEQVTVFIRIDLPPECSRIEIVNIYNDQNRHGFEITCAHCSIKSDTPQLILRNGKLLCPSCQREL